MSNSKSCIEIELFLQNKIATILNVAANSIDVDLPFTNYGLGSMQIVSLSGELQDLLQHDLDPTVFWDFPSIRQLSSAFGDNASKNLANNEVFSIKELNDKRVDKKLITITGMACRFPKANNIEEFWELLHDAKDAIAEIPAERAALLNASASIRR